MSFFRFSLCVVFASSMRLFSAFQVTAMEPTLLTTQTGRDIEFYVAPDGSDTNHGTKEEPFGSLERARDAIRELRKRGPLSGAVTVWVRGGVYQRTDTFRLTQEDSGTQESPIAYRAFITENPRLIGGQRIETSLCRAVNEPDVLERLDESVRSKVVQVDLKAHGITDYGEMTISGPMLELFYDGRRMPLARWPNEGWLTIGKCVETNGGSSRRFVEETRNGRTFQYSGDRPRRWVRSRDVELHGFWYYGWMDEHVKIDRIDTERQEITLARIPGGIKEGQWYYALNLLEEMDQPAEWYLDREKGIVYFLPPEGFPKNEVLFSILEKPLVSLENTSHVTLRGLTLEATRGAAVVIGGGSHSLIAQCIIRCIGSHAVIIDDGTKNGVLGCDIHDIGSTGIQISGGNRSTLTSGENYVVNCHIHHYAQRKKVYQPAVRLYGVGHRVAHNLIHDAPHQAIGYDGNDHVIEFNEIHDVVLESSDAGALYTGRDWTFRGNVVRYNFIHHIPHRPGFGSKVVYLDDCASSTEIFGNVFYKTRESAFIGGGRDNAVENNIFVECEQPVHLDARGLTWDHFRPGGPMYEPLKQFRHDQPPWSARYPKLARILDENPQAPLGNLVVKNLSYRSSWRDPDRKYVRLEDNFITDEDPGFVDYANMNFRLKDDSIVYRKIPGFQKIPFEKIGLYADEYRATPPPSKRQP